MAALTRVLKGITTARDLQRYNLTMADFNGLWDVYMQLAQTKRATTIQQAVYKFITRHTRLAATQKGIGWEITL